MNGKQAEEILDVLKGKAMPLEELHDLICAGGSAWTADQLRLFLHCVPGIQFDAAVGTIRVAHRGKEDELRDAIVEAVRSFEDRPVPAAEVRLRLPDHFITTDEQIRSIAKRTPGLEIVGPGLIHNTERIQK